jgi:hypothetical protein
MTPLKLKTIGLPELRRMIQELAHNFKVAATAAAATVTTGAVTILEYIPDDIGKVGMVFGLALSVLLFRIHLVTLKQKQLDFKMSKDQYEREEAARKSLLNKS